MPSLGYALFQCIPFADLVAYLSLQVLVFSLRWPMARADEEFILCLFAPCRELLSHPEIVAGQTVLEIGSGTGLCGIVAAKVGAAQVGLEVHVKLILCWAL